MVWYCCTCAGVCVFFFKQKTAYEMRISDWSSDVCSSDLAFCLLSHKTNVRNYYNAKLGKFDAQRFFNWCSRLLIERIMEFAENDAKHRGELVAPATFVFSENKEIGRAHV